MNGLSTDTEVSTRLPYLLIFRAVVATLLLAGNLSASFLGWKGGELSNWLYAIIVFSYLVVLLLGVLLRHAKTDATVLSAVHLATAGLTTTFIVEVTGGVKSPFSFLYLLVILDGAIIGGRSVALVVTILSTVVYGVQLAMQLYGIGLAPRLGELEESGFLRSFLVHGIGFFAVALLSGYLAQLMQSARAAASDVQNAFERGERQRREILSSLPVGVVTLDGSNRILSANPRARDILGDEEVVGGSVPEVLLDFLASGDRLGEVEFDEQVLSVSQADLTAVDGKPLTVLVVEDRTDLVALEHEVRLKERLASVGELAAGMAHEIRNPLAGLSGAVELIFSDASDREQQVRLERVVHREVARLNRLIGDFLAYARPVEPELRPVMLRPLARDVCAMAGADERSRDRNLQVDIPEKACVQADGEQLKQVLWNLLLNAFDASVGDDPVEITARRERDAWCIDVRDHGKGLDPAIRDQVWEPFKTTKSRGTGLGLALVQRIVSNHGGRIQLSDAPGGGAVARVWLEALESHEGVTDVDMDAAILGPASEI